MSWPDVTVVDACVRRDGRGGSPKAVTDDDPAATDADRRAVAAAAGTSHAAFLGPGRTPDGGRPVRFFTATAELSGCGQATAGRRRPARTPHRLAHRHLRRYGRDVLRRPGRLRADRSQLHPQEDPRRRAGRRQGQPRRPPGGD
ncbi:PhzF family phenazine biosynthesis protein [Streptomyces sp. NPDC014006]|uniref:PhzF family phenazine biosynthesis protein n=1 Tax=Streptomyces sp. NPDC014006 TaxID=3364870 RepID=UPI003700295D